MSSSNIECSEDIAIQVKGLSKQYMLGGAEERYESFRDLLRGVFTSPLRKLNILRGNVSEEQRLFWALKDVEFDIPVGQVTGVIGRNGAGKSTLLKILSQITVPSGGEVRMAGRVASLLEVGSGFHPELTGRENIYMNASILGMSRAEVHRKLDDIVQFAEVGKFLDTPVKRYSSGMYVRLAFSVAAHVDPDILLVDEVLAVGDAQFQQRCIGKLNEVSQDGRTVLFVSHNMGLIQELCSHSIYLKGGKVVSYGPSSDVLSDYMRDGANVSGSWKAQGEDQVVRKISIVTREGLVSSEYAYNEGASIIIEVMPDRPDKDFVLAVRVTDELGRDVFTSWDTDSVQRRSRVGQTYSTTCSLPAKLLRPGGYILTVMARNSRHGYIDKIDEVSMQFDVTDIGFKMNPERYGVILPVLDWH